MSGFRIIVVAALLVSALIFLQYRLWFDKGGIRDMVRLRKSLAVQRVELAKMKKQNNELLFQVQRIQNSSDAAEARARGELGMVKKGEVFYQVVK